MQRGIFKHAFLCFAVLVPAAVAAQVKATAYEVNLTWQAPANSTDPVAGYNAYRALSGSANYQQINTSEIVSTAYADTNAQSDQTYDYFVESVDASGVTSEPSNMASVSVPSLPPTVGQPTVKSTP